MAKQLKSFKLDTEIGDYIKDHVYFFREGMIMYPDQSCAMPVAYKDVEEEILNFNVLPDDIWVISFLKSGTTWTQEMVWLIANGLDYEGAKTDLEARFPFLEFLGLTKDYINLFGLREGHLFDDLKSKKPPRFIKSHLPVGLLPRKLWEVKPKIIYVMRDPKDVAVSLYNHYRLFPGYTGTKEKLFEAYISDHLTWGSFWGNVAPFWKMRHQPNILINNFEEMKTDLASVIRRTAEFLGKNVPEDEMDKLLKHLHFSNMQNNDFVNLKHIAQIHKNVHGVNQDVDFMNKGQVGYHKENIISTEWIQLFDNWIEQEKIKYGLDTDTDFPY